MDFFDRDVFLINWEWTIARLIDSSILPLIVQIINISREMRAVCTAESLTSNLNLVVDGTILTCSDHVSISYCDRRDFTSGESDMSIE